MLMKLTPVGEVDIDLFTRFFVIQETLIMFPKSVLL